MALSHAASHGNQADTQTVVAPVQEIFSSIQGEGPYVGLPQVFVRFAHCHLKCTYCDTPMQSASGQCEFYPEPGLMDQTLLPNPMTPDALWSALQQIIPKNRHHSVSFTGGEPLLYHRFLAELLPRVRPTIATYLETSGTQPEFLEPVLPWVSIVAMDIKLPSSSGEPPQFDKHRTFYRMARLASGTNVFAKIILNDAITNAELDAIRSVIPDRSCPIILQPVTARGSSDATMSARRLFDVQRWLMEHYDQVRVIPQTHKMMKLL